MQFEKLKKNHKKKILIGGLILVCVISAITITTSRAKYKLTQNIKLAQGTINYRSYDFKIMAMYQQKDGSSCTEDSCYNEITDRMPSTGYIINESKSYCTIDNKTHDTEVVLKTVDGNHVFNNLKKLDKCYLYFDKYVPPITVDDIIAANSPKESPTTFSGAATTDEGVYAVSDGMYNGTSYYWRGAATTNHIIFANKCWRIVRINGDKTVRLIYNGPSSESGTCTGNGANANSVIMGSSNAEKYYATSDGQVGNSSYVGWTYTLNSQRTTSGTPSNAKTQTEKWFDNNSNFTAAQREQVVNGKFCNDRDTQNNETWRATGSAQYYAAYKRMYTDRQPTLDCPSGDTYTLNVGAITLDEVMFAGGWSANNTSYYIYTGQHYWTMSPYGWDGTNAYTFYVRGSDGLITYNNVNWTYAGLRPVINLKKDVIFNTGSDGTQNNPYIVQ